MGSGSALLRLHPSPWCNPFIFLSASSEDAQSRFEQYALARRDMRQWLAPLSSQTLMAEEGQEGNHVEIIAVLLHELAGQ